MSKTRLPERRTSVAMSRSAGKSPARASTSISTTSEVSIAALVCARMRPVREAEAASSSPAVSITVKARSPSRASPSRRSRVTPGRSSTSASLRPTRRLNKVDLPTFGRPMMATTGAREAVPDELMAPPSPEDDNADRSEASSAACRGKGRDLDLCPIETLAHRLGERHGRRRVAMDADGVDGDLLHLAVDARDGLLLDHALHALGDLFRIVQHGARLAPRDEKPIVLVGAVGEDFGDGLEARLLSRLDELRERQDHEGELGVDAFDGGGERIRHHLVLAGHVGQGAVDLHIGHAVASERGDALKGADLIGDERLDLA